MFENHQNINNLGSILNHGFPKDVLQEQKAYQVRDGLEHLLRLIKTKEQMDENLLMHSCMSLPLNNLYYLSRTIRTNQEYLDYELSQHVTSLLKTAERFCDTIYIDTAENTGTSSKKILKDADMVVVNLSQHPYVMSDFFRNFSQVQEKAFYLISNYEKQSVFSKDYLIQKHGISPYQIGIMPHHISFADAMAKGELIPFLRNHYSCNRSSIHYDFMESTKEAVSLLEDFSCRLGKKGEAEYEKRSRI